jgi:biotin carboxyl carrier protein
MTRYHVAIEGNEFQVDLVPDGVLVDGEPIQAGLDGISGTRVRTLLLDGHSWLWDATGSGSGKWALQAGGRTLSAEVLDDRARTIRALVRKAAVASGPRPLRAPMPGLVVKVEVAVGDVVAPGQGLVVMEAMKMENELKSEGAGRVTRIHVEPGSTVEKDQVLVELEALAAAGSDAEAGVPSAGGSDA